MSLLVCIGYVMAVLVGALLGFYFVLCCICSLQDVFNKTTWRWKK